MKKLHVFAGSDYYPLGGLKDYIGSVDELDQVDELIKSNREYFEFDRVNWVQVVEASTMKIISEY